MTHDIDDHCPERRACIYVYTAQVRSADVARQVKACRQAAEHQGLSLHKTEIDGGRCGRGLAGRDGLVRVLEGAASGEFGTLIVKSIDRFSHDVIDVMAVLAQLKRCRINLLTVDGGRVDIDSILLGRGDDLAQCRFEGVMDQ